MQTNVEKGFACLMGLNESTLLHAPSSCVILNVKIAMLKYVQGQGLQHLQFCKICTREEKNVKVSRNYKYTKNYINACLYLIQKNLQKGGERNMWTFSGIFVLSRILVWG